MTISKNPPDVEPDVERQAEHEPTAELYDELERRWLEHLKNPGSAIPWDVVRRKLQGNE